jgi:putative spermidine/putrescine transport system ATP-binding protein
VDGVSIGIRDGEFFSMLGPSGSGKTTCLRLIAGFEQLSGGAIRIFGQRGQRTAALAAGREYRVQDYALFPHMSILDNVAYGLMVKGVDKKKRHARRVRRWKSGLALPRPQALAAFRRPAAACRDRPGAGE